MDAATRTAGIEMAESSIRSAGQVGRQKNPSLDMPKLKEEYRFLKGKYGVSARDFAAISGVPYWTVRDWRKQLRTESVSVHVEPGTPPVAVLEMMRKSGLSLRAFSNASGISYYTLRSWHRKERLKEQCGVFDAHEVQGKSRHQAPKRDAATSG